MNASSRGLLAHRRHQELLQPRANPALENMCLLLPSFVLQRPGPAREALAVPGPIYDVNASTSPRPTGPRWAADVGQAHREAHQAK
jgi:hypothetical protein